MREHFFNEHWTIITNVGIESTYYNESRIRNVSRKGNSKLRFALGGSFVDWNW